MTTSTKRLIKKKIARIGLHFALEKRRKKTIFPHH